VSKDPTRDESSIGDIWLCSRHNISATANFSGVHN
jgi:hypothetical protein